MTFLRRSSKTRLPLIGGLAAVLLAATACGGSSDSAGEATGTSLSDIREAGVLTVATEGTYRPFTFHEDGGGDLTGYDVEALLERIEVYRHHGYFDPAQLAETLLRARNGVVTEPPKLLARFAELYAG